MINDRDYIRDIFYLKKDLLYFNAGSFGICPKPVLEEKIKILREFESNPSTGFIETMFELGLENIKILASRIGANYENVAVVPNLTQGMAAVLTSIDVKTGDGILLTNFTYGAVIMQVESYFVGRGGNIHRLILNPPFQSSDQIKELYVEFVKSHPTIKFAIIDHISSAYPMVHPVKEIVKALRELGVIIIIDGAHSMGQMKELNVKSIDADVYLGNLHKWSFVPRGTAFLVVHPNCNISIQNQVISWLHDRTLNEKFIFPGTTDISNMLCIKKAFQFIDSIGGQEAIFRYNTDLLESGIKYLEKKWNVTAMQFPEMAPFMRLIPFPKGFQKHQTIIANMLITPFEKPYYKFTIEKFGFIATAVILSDRLYFRLCSQIFLEFENFVQFSIKILEWLNKLDSGETI